MAGIIQGTWPKDSRISIQMQVETGRSRSHNAGSQIWYSGYYWNLVGWNSWMKAKLNGYNVIKRPDKRGGREERDMTQEFDIPRFPEAVVLFTLISGCKAWGAPELLWPTLPCRSTTGAEGQKPSGGRKPWVKKTVRVGDKQASPFACRLLIFKSSL